MKFGEIGIRDGRLFFENVVLVGREGCVCFVYFFIDVISEFFLYVREFKVLFLNIKIVVIGGGVFKFEDKF